MKVLAECGLPAVTDGSGGGVLQRPRISCSSSDCAADPASAEAAQDAESLNLTRQADFVRQWAADRRSEPGRGP